MYIIGASGHAKAVIDLFLNKKKIKGVFDDNSNIKDILGIPVVSPIPDKYQFGDSVHIAIGDNMIRKKMVSRFLENQEYANIIHPSSLVSLYSQMGCGIVFMENTIVKVESRIGNHVILNTKVSVDHECTIGDFVHLAPNVTLCGNVHIDEGSFIGAGSVIIPGIKIGKWCTVGAGSVVHKDMPDGSKWIGSRPFPQIL